MVRARSVLPEPGRPDEQQAVAAGQGDLEPAPGLGLATDLAQVRTGGRPDPGHAIGRGVAFGWPARLDQLDATRRRVASVGLAVSG